MTNDEVKALEPYDRLLWWIKLRHAVYRRKAAGRPKPWCENELMQQTYFTNVYRELDKTTVWFRENIREPLRNTSEVLFATIAFRWFNWPLTGHLLKTRGGLMSGKDGPFGYFVGWKLDAVVDLLSRYRDEGNQVFTGAFNISNSGSSKPKIDRVCDDYIQPVWEQREKLVSFFDHGSLGKSHGPTLAAAHKMFMELPGLGGSGFMAGQVVADLRHTYLLDKAPDLKYWASIGPGSRRGMNYLHSRPPETPINSKQWQAELTDLVARVNTDLSGGSYKWPYIHGQDMQNCLCETGKMNNILFGNGRSKRRYLGV